MIDSMLNYQSPIPPDKHKQCSDCKFYKYNSWLNDHQCPKNEAANQWRIIEPAGTCDEWSNEPDEYVLDYQI
jgi:hypothetical protein